MRSSRVWPKAALDPQGLDPPRRRAARRAPVRAEIAEGAADRVLAEGIAGARRVRRVEHPVLAAVPADAELVFEAPAVGHREAQQPEVAFADAQERRAVHPAVDPAQQLHMRRMPAPREGDRAGLGQRKLVIGEEPVDRGRLRRAVGEQRRDRRMMRIGAGGAVRGRWKALVEGHGFGSTARSGVPAGLSRHPGPCAAPDR
jgi:hypothetical protein